MYINWFAVLGFLFLFLGVLMETSTIPRLVKEVRRPKDGFSRLRWYVLARPIMYVMTFTPYLFLLFTRINKPPVTNLGAWVTVSVPFGLMWLALFTYLSYTYKEKQ